MKLSRSDSFNIKIQAKLHSPKRCTVSKFKEEIYHLNKLSVVNGMN